MDYEEFLKSIGENIDRIRQEKELSYRELAFRSDIEKSNLVTLCTQGRNVTMKTIYKIAQGLEVPPSELLKDSNNSNAR